jgi:hypothetical protein
MKMQVANAFSNGPHKILWLAGGYAVYLKDGKQELFECLDEAVKKAGVTVEQDPRLLKEWAGGYELPADEDQNWPEVFLQKEGD